ncbi:hypothetical protein Tco_0351679 [Tanacetum coccineum]
MMILGRPFLVTIHAQIDVFNGEISLGIGEDRLMFDVNGNTRHPKVLIEKVYVTYSIQDDESFNLLEIGDDLFSYESPACLQFEQCTRSCDDKIDHKRHNVKGNCIKFEDFLQDLVLNEWVLDSFDVEGDYANKFDDPYSRRFDEYKKVFNNEKCEQYHDGVIHAWHDERFEEDELWKSGIKKTEYEPPFVNIETFNIKRYSFKGGRSFVYITKQLDDALPLGRENRLRFMEIVRY